VVRHNPALVISRNPSSQFADQFAGNAASTSLALTK
jgi:hypothetical protein